MNNTVGNYVKHLKTFLKYAKERGYSINEQYSKFKVFKEDSQQVSLTENELKQIIEVDLSQTPRLQNVRDLFVIQCLTALRYSDLANLKPENFKGDYIIINAIKTKDNLIIPIVNKVKSIIKNLDFDTLVGKIGLKSLKNT